MRVMMLKSGDLPVSGCKRSRVTDRTKGDLSLIFLRVTDGLHRQRAFFIVC